MTADQLLDWAFAVIVAGGAVMVALIAVSVAAATVVIVAALALGLRSGVAENRRKVANDEETIRKARAARLRGPDLPTFVHLRFPDGSHPDVIVNQEASRRILEWAAEQDQKTEEAEEDPQPPSPRTIN